MPTDEQLIFKIIDINYEDGMNTFGFLASPGYYIVSLRHKACTLLFTNFHIQVVPHVV